MVGLDPTHLSLHTRRREVILEAPSTIQGDQNKSPANSPCTSDLKIGNKVNVSASSVNKHDGFNFAAVAFSPLVTKQTRPPRKKKTNRSMKQQPQEQSQKPNKTEANRSEVDCGNLKYVENPSSAKRRVTFKDELVKVVVAKTETQNTKEPCSHETKDTVNDAATPTSIEGQVLKGNNDISRDSDMKPTKHGKWRDDGEGARPARDASTETAADASTETAVVGRAGMRKPLLTERLHRGKGSEGQSDEVTDGYNCRDETITHPEPEGSSSRDEQSEFFSVKNAGQLPMTSEQPPHDRCSLRHPTIRICKVTSGEEYLVAKQCSLTTSQHTPVAKTTDELRHEGEYVPEDDDDKVLVIDETRCKALTVDAEESVARRATAEDTVGLLRTASSVDGTKCTLSTTQHQTTLAGEVVLPAEMSKKDDVQDTNQTDCGPPYCTLYSRPKNSLETKNQEVKGKNDDNQTSDIKVAVLPSSSVVSCTKPSLVLCGSRSSSYSTPRSLPTKTPRGSGGNSRYVPAFIPADTTSKQTRLMAARLQTGTAQSSSIDSLHLTSKAQNSNPLNTESSDELSSAESSAQRVHACTFPLFDIKDGGQCNGSIHSTSEVRYFPDSQNTKHENLISVQNVETRRLLAPSYFKSPRAPDQSLQKSSFINQVHQTSDHSSVPPSVQIMANTNFKGRHYMVLAHKVATPQQEPHQVQIARPQIHSLQPQLVPPTATALYRAPHTSTGGPAQYKQTAVQSTYPGGQGSFEISGTSSHQRFKQSQPLHQMNPQVVRLTQPSEQTRNQLISPVVFSAPAPIDPLHMTARSLRSTEDQSLDATFARRVHARSFPSFDLSNGGQCKGSIAYTNQTDLAMPTTQTQPPQWTQQTGWSSKIKPPFPQRTAPQYLQEIQPPPPPPQARQVPHQVRVLNHPSGTIREQHVTPNDRQARVSPSSLIPNGTLFVQTPQGLVQIQQNGQMNRPQTGCQQHISATRKTTHESVFQSTFERQNQGNAVSEGRKPSTAAVATLTPASTVLMKSDKLSGVRLPYPMPTQKQLLFLARNTKTSNPPKTKHDAPRSNREVKAGIKSHADKDAGSTRPSTRSERKIFENSSEIHAERDSKKSTRTTTKETTTTGVKNGSKEGTTHSKTLAASENNEDGYEDKHKTSSGKGNLIDDASKNKSRIETKSIQLNDAEHQHSKSVSGLPRSSYVKFLDSSVTVKCMYFPKVPSVLEINEERETGEEGSNDPSPSETLLDATTSDGCKNEETSVNFSLRSAPLRNEQELEDEGKVQGVHSSERQRRGGNNKSSVSLYTEAESDDDIDDELWHPGLRKSSSRYTRRFRNPRTGGLSKINIQTSAKEGSGQPPDETLINPTTEEDTKGENLRAEPEIKSKSKSTCLKLEQRKPESKRGKEIVDELGPPETNGTPKDILEGEINRFESPKSSASSSGSSFQAERKLEASPTKSTIRMTQRTPEKRLNSNSNKNEKQPRKTVIPGTPIVKTQAGSNANSPSKRTRQRSSQSRSSDSDNLSSKYPKKISSRKGFHKHADTATSPSIGHPRSSPRRLHNGYTKQRPAPLWQRVLKMLGLKKKKPVRFSPSGAKAWHKRRSSSVVLAESLAESARRLEKTKDQKNEGKDSFAETDSLPFKKKGSEKNRSLTEEKQCQEGDQKGSKQSSKKKRQTKTKKQHKRLKIIKKAKVSPESTTDPASGSLTSIDFDSRRQTRSRTRQDSDSLSSLADSASSASPSARRGRRTLASISAQTWEDCYRCTYLKWKETNESPETLTNDEGFKVMTNELATPSRAGPSKDKKCFQKLLMSKWDDIVQTAHTGTVEDKMEPEVGDDEGWPFEMTSCSFVETPPVASELSVCTTDCFKDASTFAQQGDWNVYGEDTDTVVSSQVDIKSEELDDAAAASNALLGTGDRNVVESYGYPPVLNPIQGYTEIQDAHGRQHPSQDTPSYFIPQTLTEETLQLLAQSGTIDSDLNGLQAFALFMQESGGTDQYGDPSSTSPLPQPVSSDGEEDIPPVISCHKLNTDEVTHGDRTVDDEKFEENINRSRSNLFYIPVPLTKERESQEYVNKLLELSDAPPHSGATETEEQGDSFHHKDAETGNNSDHGNEEEGVSLEGVFLRKMESSLEEGEIIDESGFSDYKK